MLPADSPARVPGYLRGDKAHVVIAEDNAITRRMIELVLKDMGWTFDSAPDGVAALSAVERAGPNLALVLSDVEMPKMTGLALVESMKSIPSLAKVPVILMSSPDREPEARAVGCAAFLPKPFSVPRLLDALNI